MNTFYGINQQRISRQQEGRDSGGPVIYWMTREQRVADNWAFLLAQNIALEQKRGLIVVFCLVADYPGANIRHYGFMLKGLREVEQNLRNLRIPLVLLQGHPPETLLRYLKKVNGSFLVTDFDPLRIKRAWQGDVGAGINCSFFVVDAHNIVPCRYASSKQEYGAYTLRPKINKVLDDYLCEFPGPVFHPFHSPDYDQRTDWRLAETYVRDHSVPELDRPAPGGKGAMKHAEVFLAKGLAAYGKNRNDPNRDGQSDISPYLHFGQIAPQRLALMVQKAKVSLQAKEAFLEELIVRRELADNFCYYNDSYDSFAGFPAWGQKTLDDHRNDKREYLYSGEEFENGLTHDGLWNAAQFEMVVRGKMHGYMRMYWAKKILAWSATPEEAMQTAIFLNDKYSLDGRDPNGYAGIAWSIGGVHDRAWKERPVFGKIRYMSYAGCARKFDVDRYISSWKRK